ncbi:hypothetical protein Tco_0670096 [Tanacetum coccineum]
MTVTKTQDAHYASIGKSHEEEHNALRLVFPVMKWGRSGLEEDSKSKDTTAMSATESEYIDASKATMEAV